MCFLSRSDKMRNNKRRIGARGVKGAEERRSCLSEKGDGRAIEPKQAQINGEHAHHTHIHSHLG